MSSSTSNLSVDEQQVTIVVAKRKEEDVMAQAVAATVHWEQEALVVAVATACKTLDEARAREHAAALSYEKEQTIVRLLE
jgi:predicted nucleic acid-binding protein